MKRISPCYYGMVALVIICIAIGYFTARANAAEEKNPTWELLKGELSGESPNKVSIEQLSAAMAGAMLQHPEQAMPLFTTCVIIACNSKPYPKRSVVFVLYTATLTVPEIADEFIEYARKICPQSGAHEKVVLPQKPIEEDLSAPMNFAGLTPGQSIYSAVTPVVER